MTNFNLKHATFLLFAIFSMALTACGGGSSSSGGGSDKIALRCVDIADMGSFVTVTNTCPNHNIWVRFFGNNTPSFFIPIGESVNVPISQVSNEYGACEGPYKPRTGDSSGTFVCED